MTSVVYLIPHWLKFFGIHRVWNANSAGYKVKSWHWNETEQVVPKTYRMLSTETTGFPGITAIGKVKMFYFGSKCTIDMI